MGYASKLRTMLQKQKWIMPACFVLSIVMTSAAIVLCRVKGFAGMNNEYTFSIGADLVSMAVCTVMLYSCIQDREGSEHTRTFVLLITMTSAVLFSDVCCWMFQGEESLRVLNLIANVLNYTNTAALLFYFWRYVVTALDLEGHFMNVANMIMNILYVPTLFACLLNLFIPLYFSVDESGYYKREPLFLFSQTYLAIGLVFIIIGLIISRVSLRERIITASFVVIPVANQIITGYKFGISTEFAAMLVSIVLIFGVLFAEREKTLASTEKELSMATGIQTGILPRTFPPYPERKEFELYASMDPAKEVGGDFYDFFLIDEDHLGLVIADVSGKGVPAALFMMASKMLINTYATFGGTPADILGAVNERVCGYDADFMFVTVWLGILEISTGKMTCCNAGHEYPVLKKANGSFEMIKDKHGLSVGAMAGVKYRNYELLFEKGDTLFVYTDGVPESTNNALELFGNERMLEALNSAPDSSLQELLGYVKKASEEFVGDAVQFDDLTMLAIRYIGK